MADSLTLSIDTREWEKLLADLPKRVARRAVREALQAGGDVLAEAMSAEAPVRTDTPTPGSNALPPGILAADITAQVQIGTKFPPRVKVGATAIASHVAWWIENGFDHYEGGRIGKGGVKGTHVDANPFMARAFDTAIGRSVEVALESLSTSLTKDINDPSSSGGAGEA